VYAIPASEMAAGKYKDRIIGDPMNGKCYERDTCYNNIHIITITYNFQPYNL